MIKNQQGLTLLELLIVLVILATLTVFSSKSIQQALFSKSKIQTQIDEMSRVRDALRIIELDVNLAYHDRDLESEFRKALKKAQTGPTPTPVPGAAPPAPTPTPPPTQDEQTRAANRLDPSTQFEGKSEKMDLVTLNSGRLAENQAQADFIKVGYELKHCKRLTGSQSQTKCLMRRMSPLVEGDVTEGGENTVLLENVTEFKLRYFGKGRQDWTETWSSKEGDAVAKGNFPGAVEVSLTVENGEGDKKRKISMQIVAQVRFPNNPEKQQQGSPAGGMGP